MRKIQFEDKEIHYSIENNILKFSAKDCALAFGIVSNERLKNGNISKTVRWRKVYRDFIKIGKIDNNVYKWSSNEEKLKARQFMKETMVTKEELISWGNLQFKNDTNRFLQFITNANIYNINDFNNISINSIKRQEIKFLDMLEEFLKPFNIIGTRQFKTLNYKIDYYIEKLNIAIEYDEHWHSQYEYREEIGRQNDIENELGCTFIRVKDQNKDMFNCGVVLKGILKIYGEKIYS